MVMAPWWSVAMEMVIVVYIRHTDITGMVYVGARG